MNSIKCSDVYASRFTSRILTEYKEEYYSPLMDIFHHINVTRKQSNTALEQLSNNSRLRPLSSEHHFFKNVHYLLEQNLNKEGHCFANNYFLLELFH